MLVSLHTPKAGGTSFRNLLEQHFKKKLQTDYDNPLNKSFEERIYKQLILIKSLDCIRGICI